MNFLTMIKQPSAFLPVAMSFAALAEVLVMFGVAPEADEGTAAYLWQIPTAVTSLRQQGWNILAYFDRSLCFAEARQ